VTAACSTAAILPTLPRSKAVASRVHRAGGEIVTGYTEIESGKRADRAELRAALAEAKRCRTTLVIARLDRLSRNMAFVANLMDVRVEFIACDNAHANRLTLSVSSISVPEPAMRAIMLMGFALLGGAVRRHRCTLPLPS
jgi:hypothetical protein